MRNLVILALAVTLAACARAGEPRFEPDASAKGVAVVNGVVLTEADLEYWMGRNHHGPAPDEAARKQALEALIAKELVRQAAYKRGLDRETPVADKLLRLRAQHLASEREELAAAFYRAQEADAVPAEAEVRAYFDAHADELRTEVRLLQITAAKDPAGIADAKQALDGGAAFEDVARRRFPGLPPEQRPWDLGYVRWLQIPPELRATVGKLAPGATSEIIKGAGDRWWILKVVDKRVNDAITFDTERQAIASVLQGERLAKLRDERAAALRKDADVKYLGVD